MTQDDRREAERIVRLYVAHRWEPSQVGVGPKGYSAPMGSGKGEPMGWEAALIDGMLGRIQQPARRRRLERMLCWVHLDGLSVNDFPLYEHVARQIPPSGGEASAEELAAVKASQDVADGGCLPSYYKSPQDRENERARREIDSLNHLTLGLMDLGSPERLMGGIAWLMLSDFYRAVWKRAGERVKV